MGILGTVVAFIGGGFLLKLYTHIDTIDTSTLVGLRTLQYYRHLSLQL